MTRGICLHVNKMLKELPREKRGVKMDAINNNFTQPSGKANINNIQKNVGRKYCRQIFHLKACISVNYKIHAHIYECKHETERMTDI